MAIYKRSIFVINPKFQYYFAFLICSLVFVASLIYPITIYDIYAKVIELQPQQAQELSGNREQLLTLLFVVQVAFVGLVFVLCIFISHKIAGPLYKLKNYLIDIREGKEITPLYFRKGDNFHDVAEEVTLTMEFFNEQRAQDFEYLNEVSSYIANLSLVVPEDKKPVLNEIQRKLSQIQSRYQN